MSNLEVTRPGPVVKAIQDSGAGDKMAGLFWFWSYCSSRGIGGWGGRGQVGMPHDSAI